MLGALVLCAAVVAGCGSGSDRLGISTRRDRGTLLYLGSRSSITALSPTSGSVRFEEAGAVPSRDWSVLYATANHGTSTTLRELDARTGDTLSTREMPGTFVVRTVSDNGGIVVLAPPNPNGNDAYHPYPKSQTELMIARRGDSEVQHMTVDGNVEPEAISLSGKALFVIDFIPPLAPERYRVARLDLGVGPGRRRAQRRGRAPGADARYRAGPGDGTRWPAPLHALHPRRDRQRTRRVVRARARPGAREGDVRGSPARVRVERARSDRGDAVGNARVRGGNRRRCAGGGRGGHAVADPYRDVPRRSASRHRPVEPPPPRRRSIWPPTRASPPST